MPRCWNRDSESADMGVPLTVLTDVIGNEVRETFLSWAVMRLRFLLQATNARTLLKDRPE